MIIKLIVDGGEMKPGPTVAQQLGPAGINIGQVISKVNDSTKEFKGMKVPIALDVNTKTKTFTVSVSTPTTSALIKKELGIESASGKAKAQKAGNLAIEQVIAIAKMKSSGMIISSFKSAVKLVVGSCVSSGILIESKDPKEVMVEIDRGVYDKEIKLEKTQVDKEKRKELDKYFNELKGKQELELKKLEEKKAEEEAAKAAATAAAGKATTPSAGAKPGEVAAPVAGAKPAEAAKKPAGKK